MQALITYEIITCGERPCKQSRRTRMARGRFSKRLYRVGINWRIEHVTLDLNTPFDLLWVAGGGYKKPCSRQPVEDCVVVPAFRSATFFSAAHISITNSVLTSTLNARWPWKILRTSSLSLSAMQRSTDGDAPPPPRNPTTKHLSCPLKGLNDWIDLRMSAS